MGKIEKSCEVLEKVLSLMPRDVAGTEFFWDVCNELSRMYKKTGRPEKSVEVYESIIKKYEDHEIRKRAEIKLRELK